MLVVDTGTSIVGIYSVQDGVFIPYQSEQIATAIERIVNADEVVTYNGKNRDLQDLARFAGMEGDLLFKGVHRDMRSIIWSDRIWGSDLPSTYSKHFTDCPTFPNSYEGDNERDCYIGLPDLLHQLDS